MSLKVDSVSNVNFRGNEFLERPGKYANAPIAENNPGTDEFVKPKKGKKVLKAAIGIVAVAAALVGLAKFGAVKELETLEGAGILAKLQHYTAKAGNAIAKYTIDPVIGLLRRNKT